MGVSFMSAMCAILFLVVVLTTDHVKYLLVGGIGYGRVCNPRLSFLSVLYSRPHDLVGWFLWLVVRS
jgi:hypothetical protein